MFDEGSHPMHNAARSGEIDTLNRLLNEGADVDARNDRGRTAVMLAAAAGHVDVATALRDRGADLSLRDLIGDTAFHCAIVQACESSDTTLIGLMLAWGADIHASGKRGGRPLEAPAMLCSDSVLRFLLERGADPNGAPSAKGRSLISTALMAGRGSLATITTLLEYGADVEPAGRTGSTPLMLAVSLSATRPGDTDGVEDLRTVVKLLIDNGADVNAKDTMGTVLAKAIEAGDVEIVRLLLDAGARVRDPGDVPRFARFPGVLRPAITALLRERGARISGRFEPSADLPEGFAASMSQGTMPDFVSPTLGHVNAMRQFKDS